MEPAKNQKAPQEAKTERSRISEHLLDSEEVLESWEDLIAEVDPPEEQSDTNLAKENTATNGGEHPPDVGRKSGKTAGRLRAPVVGVVGHVDAGKTTFLDNLQGVSIQAQEAGGITQENRAVYIPVSELERHTRPVAARESRNPSKIPGMLLFDTPGHRCFAKSRIEILKRCDFAVLIIDIMNGVEEETIVCLEQLKVSRVPFMIALTKLDMLKKWSKGTKSLHGMPKTMSALLETKREETILSFHEHVYRVKESLLIEGICSQLFFDLTPREYRNNAALVPLSSVTGEGVSDLITLLVSLLQKTRRRALEINRLLDASVVNTYMTDKGGAVDILLRNGSISVGTTLMGAAIDGSALESKVRRLERVSDEKRILKVSEKLQSESKVSGVGVYRVYGKGLEAILLGSPIATTTPGSEGEADSVESLIRKGRELALPLQKEGTGLSVAASSAGMLYGLLDILEREKIPVSKVKIGPITSSYVSVAAAIKSKNILTDSILALNVSVTLEVAKEAETQGIIIITSDIVPEILNIYREHRDITKRDALESHQDELVYPCILKLLPGEVFHKTSPIVLGVRVLAGRVRVGVSLLVPTRGMLLLGRVTTIKDGSTDRKQADIHEEVSVRIESVCGERDYVYGRHFSEGDSLMSSLDRKAIDRLKSYDPDFLKIKSNYVLVKRIKASLGIL